MSTQPGPAALRPAVLVDVDGVLNPDDRALPGFALHRLEPAGVSVEVVLNPEHGRWLCELAEGVGAELAWASTWCSYANELIAPRVGLPELAWVPLSPQPPWGAQSVLEPGEWKARQVAAWAGVRPFVWFEDEIGAGEQMRRIRRRGLVGEHLVVRVRSRRGLGPEHLDKARAWLEGRK